jgi:hypothetical protein
MVESGLIKEYASEVKTIARKYFGLVRYGDRVKAMKNYHWDTTVDGKLTGMDISRKCWFRRHVYENCTW